MFSTAYHEYPYFVCQAKITSMSMMNVFKANNCELEKAYQTSPMHGWQTDRQFGGEIPSFALELNVDFLINP